MLAQLVKDYPQDVRVAYRSYPLAGHDKSLLATQAAEAADLQGKFWEMHDLIFAKQADWAAMTPDQFDAWLKQQAPEIGLNVDRFTTDMKSDAIVKKAADDQKKGDEIGIPGTPFMLINGKIWQGPNDLQNLTAVIELLRLEKRTFSGCPPMTIDKNKQYIATLKTDKGDIVIQLFPDKAPITVNSFVFLARKGWFNNIIFHRVIENFVAQTGDPSGTGYGGPGYAFRDEISPDLKFDKEGVVAMANSGTDTNGSQFFITLGPQPDLNGKYTIFGQVIQGMDVVKSLQLRNPQVAEQLPPGSKLLSVTIEEK